MTRAAPIAPSSARPPGDAIPPLPPATGPILVFALSGLGKSHLCARWPDVTFDTDAPFDAALADALPDVDGVRARRIAWRALARSRPWARPGHPDLARWAATRRRFVAAVLDVLRRPEPRMVLTNMLLWPWPCARYYGVTLGGYARHWAHTARVPDNAQDEAQNAHLEGFAPLVRLPPGRFLSDQPDLVAWLEAAR